MADLGTKLNLARKALGWSKEQVAEFIGVDSITIDRYEKCVRFPQRRHLAKVNEFLRLSSASTSGIHPGVSSANIPHVIADQLEEKINLLSIKDRALVVRIVNRLLAEANPRHETYF